MVKPPVYTSPDIPTPPSTTKDPVVVLVLAIPPFTLKIPAISAFPFTDKVNVVKLYPIFTFPPIPTPPETIKAPVVVLILLTVLVMFANCD